MKLSVGSILVEIENNKGVRMAAVKLNRMPKQLASLDLVEEERPAASGGGSGVDWLPVLNHIVEVMPDKWVRLGECSDAKSAGGIVGSIRGFAKSHNSSLPGTWEFSSRGKRIYARVS